MWDVILMRMDADPGKYDYYFTSGWDDVVEDNELENNDELFFAYHGNCVFTMSVRKDDGDEKFLDEIGTWNDLAIFGRGKKPKWIDGGEPALNANVYLSNNEYDGFIIKMNTTYLDGRQYVVSLSFVYNVSTLCHTQCAIITNDVQLIFSRLYQMSLLNKYFRMRRETT